MGTRCNNEHKTNREITWLRRIQTKAKVFFRYIFDTNRHFPTGPGLFVAVVSFRAGVIPYARFFFDVTKAGVLHKGCSPHSPSTLAFFRYIVTEDRATWRRPERRNEAQGRSRAGDVGLSPLSCLLFSKGVLRLWQGRNAKKQR